MNLLQWESNVVVYSLKGHLNVRARFLKGLRMLKMS